MVKVPVQEAVKVFLSRLSGRRMVRTPQINDRSQETGKVVVDITVDKDGNVVAAIPGGRGSTTTSAYLMQLAKDAAMKAKFNPSPEGADIQKGTISFVFLGSIVAFYSASVLFDISQSYFLTELIAKNLFFNFILNELSGNPRLFIFSTCPCFNALVLQHTRRI